MIESNVSLWTPALSIPMTVGWEKNFWAAESFVSDGNDITVGKFVLLFHVAGSCGFVHLFLEIKSTAAKLFLDVTDNFLLGRGVETVATFHEDLLQVAR